MSDVDSILKQFLDEKKRISGSERTIQTYHSTLKLFRTQLIQNGLDLFPILEEEEEINVYREKIIKEIEKYTTQKSLSTNKLRKSVLSSFYRFLQIKLYFPNPVMQDPSVKKKMKNVRLVKKQLVSILTTIRDDDTGKRDKAILCLLLELGIPNWILCTLKTNQFQNREGKLILAVKQEEKSISCFTAEVIIELGTSLYGGDWRQYDMPLFVSLSPSKKGKYEQITSQGISGIIKMRTGERKPYMETSSFLLAVSSIGKK